MDEKISKRRGDKNDVQYVIERQMLVIRIIRNLKEQGIEVDKKLILEKLASVGYKTSLRTLERDIASIAGTDAGTIFGNRYSGLKTSPGIRYVKKIRDDKTYAGTIPGNHYAGLKTSPDRKDTKTIIDDGASAAIIDAILFRQKYGHKAAMKKRKERVNSIRETYHSMLHPQDTEKLD